MYEIGAVSRRDAAALMIELKKPRRVKRSHAQRLAERSAELTAAIAYRGIHGDIGPRESAIGQRQSSALETHLAAVK